MRRVVFGISIVAVFGALTACTSPAVQLNVNQAAPNVNVASNQNVAVATNVNTTLNVNVVANVNAVQTNMNVQVSASLVSPLDRQAERVSKKRFGTYITPKTSPVQPERFTGYHTGVDFETFANEAKIDVPVVAACAGYVRAAQTVSGYGGVLVQDCTVAGLKVTAFYGHLRLSSINAKVSSMLNAGTQFAVLGTEYSAETDGERKHLHFSLHKGPTISWKGYVSTIAALVDWLDPMGLLPL